MNGPTTPIVAPSPRANPASGVAEIPAWLIEGLKTLNDPDQGMNYSAGHYGKERFDPDTGRPYFTRGRPAELTVYSGRADFLYRLIRESKALVHLLATCNDSLQVPGPISNERGDE